MEPVPPAVAVAAVRHVQNAVARRVRAAASLEAAARGVCDAIYEEMRAGEGGRESPAIALVRCFKTHPLGDVAPALRSLADEQLSGIAPARPEMPCMLLLASRGDEPAWNGAERSRRHRIVPLPSAEMVARRTMLARLLQSFGVGYGELEAQRSPPSEGRPSAFDIFHVEHADGSADIPDQEDFVRPFGIRSVVGFGGPLRGRDLYAVMLFSRARISVEVAQRMRSLALDITSSFFRFPAGQTFERDPVIPVAAGAARIRPAPDSRPELR